MHFTSGTTVILRSAPKLNSVTIALAYVFKLKHYLRFLGRFDISPHSLLQLAERFVRSVQELNFSIVGHSRWSFKIEYYKHIHCQHTIPKASNSKAIFGHDALTQAILFSAPGHFHRCRSSRQNSSCTLAAALLGCNMVSRSGFSLRGVCVCVRACVCVCLCVSVCSHLSGGGDFDN